MVNTVIPTSRFFILMALQLTDWLAHVPKEVLANNFAVPASAFDHIPERALYIFPTDLPEDDSKGPKSPQGTVPEPFTFKFSEQKYEKVPGGQVKIVDSTTFKVSTTIAAAEVVVEPGAIRELHVSLFPGLVIYSDICSSGTQPRTSGVSLCESRWLPSFRSGLTFGFSEGEGRMTIFASGDNSRTFNYQPGDIGYVPASQGHYVQNIGNTTLRFLEIFNSARFQDISLNQVCPCPCLYSHSS
jgi:oxalate decarboxylase/phosphoglucose isomerase-like protein (cupin superfamily)